jgi:hypothetical protein
VRADKHSSLETGLNPGSTSKGQFCLKLEQGSHQIDIGQVVPPMGISPLVRAAPSMRSALGIQHASRVGTQLQINSEEALYHTRFSERLNQLSTGINGQYRSASIVSRMCLRLHSKVIISMLRVPGGRQIGTSGSNEVRQQIFQSINGWLVQCGAPIEFLPVDREFLRHHIFNSLGA